MTTRNTPEADALLDPQNVEGLQTLFDLFGCVPTRDFDKFHAIIEAQPPTEKAELLKQFYNIGSFIDEYLEGVDYEPESNDEATGAGE